MQSRTRRGLIVIAAAACLSATDFAAHAQGVTVGVAPDGPIVVGAPVGVAPDGGIAQPQIPAFREYVIEQNVPEYTVPERVIVGAVLPETGITTYDVPQTYGATPYRYTVVNGRTVLVEPQSRRIIQVVE